MAVTFLKPCQQGSLYNTGEVAGFDKACEASLIKQGFAEPYKAPAAQAQVKADAKVDPKVDVATQSAK